MKFSAAASCGLLLLSSSVFAEPTANDKNPWNVSIFASYINASSDRLLHTVGSGDDEGAGIAGAVGYRINPNWETRFIMSHWGLESDGDAYGLDMLYHFTKQEFYAIGGIKHDEIGFDSDELINLGLGKRFALNDQWFFTAEALLTQSFDDSNNDFIANLGLTYMFGNAKPMPEVKPAPVPAAVVKAPVDSDKDGVYDDKDACPNTPMIDAVDSQGCSIYTTEDETIHLSINFANNDDRVQQSYYPEIQRLAEFMAKYPNSTVVIEGHTSVLGGATYNQQLSERRAKNVASILVSKNNIDASRVSHVGYGESRLKNTANTKQAHTENRRIKAVVSGSKQVKVRR